GAEKVEWLEGPHDPLKLTIDEIKVLKAKFRQWLRDLKERAA
ncbi:TPA: recombination protein NinG, partial [Pseudomonas aeruginosa]|nr:recombination protein NinG [Pseudomonas aeruginosa]